MHLHGHYFWVLKQGSSAERLASPDYYKNIVKNNSQPAVMDTIDVPPGGYAVIRFIADNAGEYGLLQECHVKMSKVSYV